MRSDIRTSRNGTEDEAQWIVITAAKIIRDEIREKSIIVDHIQPIIKSNAVVKEASGFHIILKHYSNYNFIRK